MKFRLFTAAMVAALFVAVAGSANAKTFRWAASGDAATLDPHGISAGLTLGFLGNIYDGLVRRAGDLSLEAALATDWSATGPTTWRFNLRKGVKFHDGSSFSADDVVFSFQRAAAKSSGVRAIIGSIKSVTAAGDYAVEITTGKPDPLLPQSIANWFIVSRAWADKNGAVDAASPAQKKEGYATNHANGTGPFMLVSREAGTKTVLKPFAGWWDTAEHNVTEAIFHPVKSAATRVAALLSGELELIYPVPVQDSSRVAANANFKMLTGTELRTIFVGMDVTRDELLHSTVKGKNPFKDVRVRQALYHAINVEAIRKKVMRGTSTPAGLLIGPGINGFKQSMNSRLAFDPAKAKALLADAGYPGGFGVGMDCTNDRYVNDAAICTAIVTMLAKVGIKVQLNADSKSRIFAKYKARDTSLYLLGWTAGTYDAHHIMRFLLSKPDSKRKLGSWNFGGYSNARIDVLRDQIAVEVDQAKRQAMIDEVHTIMRADLPYIPLHQQALSWGIRSNVDLVQRADNFFQLRWVKVN
jgi:peptide/nickel transport system substrate-binding protein